MSTLYPARDANRPSDMQSRKRLPLWMRIATWTGGALLCLVILTVIACTFIVHSRRFHDYFLAKVERQASDSLGTQVKIENFTVRLSTLSLDIYGLTIHGAPPYPDPPLLQVRHAEVGVRVVSVFRRKWYLSSFRVDSPVVKIFTDANGVTNIPTIKSSGRNGNTNIFDIGVREAMLDKGEVYYNDKKSILAADLHYLEFRALFDPVLRKYSGTLSYSDGHLQSGSFQPIAHDLQAEFDATPTTFHLTQAKLISGASHLDLSATMNDYAQPDVQAHYEAVVNGSELRQTLNMPTLPDGLLHAVGNVQYHQDPHVSLIDSLVIAGDLDSQRLDVRARPLRTQVDKITAHYSLAGGNATLQDFRATLLGGEVTAQGEMDDIGGNSHSSIKAALHGLSLADLERVVRVSNVPKNVGVSGRLDHGLVHHRRLR